MVVLTNRMDIQDKDNRQAYHLLNSIRKLGLKPTALSKQISLGLIHDSNLGASTIIRFSISEAEGQT